MDRLSAALRACEAYLPRGSHWTKPDGGMNIWVELPAPLTADALLDDVRRHGRPVSCRDAIFRPASRMSAGSGSATAASRPRRSGRESELLAKLPLRS